ncbi:MAG TPA: radical SAM protein [Blastocatellia bacterium]|nr:radical SAM protein [Blastocatellia bacterium]
MKALTSIGAVVRNSLRIDDRHFRFDLSGVEGLALFREYVELIEWETTSYCNRTCSFCPNSFIDRLSEKLAMPEAAWQAILEGLRAVDYRGTIVWSRYSEPLSERQIIERIRQVRQAAPRARIAINSNGDYLDADYLRQLEEAGLDRLWLDVYFPDDEAYDHEAAGRYHDKLLRRIQRSASLLSRRPELAYRIASEKTEVVSRVRNVASMKALDLSDRGGLIQIARQTARFAPCYAPYKHLVIDWDGSVVICCQLRSDSPAHQGGVVAKIGTNGTGLVDAYVRLAGWRRGLRGYGPKKGPCATCNVSEYVSTRLTRSLSRWLSNPRSLLRGGLRLAMRPVLKRKLRY